MPDANKLPFHSFNFWIIEGRQPRSQMRLKAPVNGGEFYQLSITRGSATNPLSSVNREVPVDVATTLRDALQNLGAFGWEEAYGDAAAPGSRRWSLSIVFEKDVFSIEAKGGSDVPARFDELLEELYRLDFPRPAKQQVEGTEGIGGAIGNAMGAMGINSIGAMNAGDLGAYAATKGADRDFSYLKGLFGASGIPKELGDFDINDLSKINPSEMQQMISDLQSNPEALQSRMKEEFRHMSPDEQNALLDMLAASGTATREWWERFLRGL